MGLLEFPYTFRKPNQEPRNENDRPGDPTLKSRIEHNESGQHDAIVTWAVEGAIARYVHKDNMEFPTSHSLFQTTNYIPVVNETDHGTWRRLGLLEFPYTFRKPNQELHRIQIAYKTPTI